MVHSVLYGKSCTALLANGEYSVTHRNEAKLLHDAPKNAAPEHAAGTPERAGPVA